MILLLYIGPLHCFFTVLNKPHFQTSHCTVLETVFKLVLFQLGEWVVMYLNPALRIFFQHLFEHLIFTKSAIHDFTQKVLGVL